MQVDNDRNSSGRQETVKSDDVCLCKDHYTEPIHKIGTGLCARDSWLLALSLVLLMQVWQRGLGSRRPGRCCCYGLPLVGHEVVVP